MVGDAYDSDKDKSHYETLPGSQANVAGPSHDQPKVTSMPSNSPEEKEADITKPVDSNITGPVNETPIQDIAYIDKKEDGHLNIHHGDRKQTNTTFENEKIGEHPMRKLAEEALKNYSLIKQAGTRGLFDTYTPSQVIRNRDLGDYFLMQDDPQLKKFITGPYKGYQSNKRLLDATEMKDLHRILATKLKEERDFYEGRVPRDAHEYRAGRELLKTLHQTSKDPFALASLSLG